MSKIFTKDQQVLIYDHLTVIQGVIVEKKPDFDAYYVYIKGRKNNALFISDFIFDNKESLINKIYNDITNLEVEINIVKDTNWIKEF